MRTFEVGLGLQSDKRPEEYEATLAPMYAWIDAVAEQGGVAGRGGGSVQVRAWRGLQGSGAGPARRRAVAGGFDAVVGDDDAGDTAFHQFTAQCVTRAGAGSGVER